MKSIYKQSYKLQIILIILGILIQKTHQSEPQGTFELKEQKVIGNNQEKENISIDNQDQGKRPQTVIFGHSKINDIMYETECECKPIPKQEDPEKAYCDPTKLKLIQDKEGEGANMEEIRQLLGNLQELQYKDPRETSFKCMDGREQQPMFATPGGDAGEFILALFVYENMTRKLDQESVTTFFKEYLKYMKQDVFYMCTDDEAISHLESEVGISMNLNVLKNPSEADKKELIKALLKSDNQGDRHLKSLLRNAELYGLNTELVQMFIVAYFKVLWDPQSQLKEKLDIQSLVGNASEETAFLEVRSNEICEEYNLAPLISSRKKIQITEHDMQDNKKMNKQQQEEIFQGQKTVQAFINHIDAASSYRFNIAKFFSDEMNHHQQPIDYKVMHHRMNKHGLNFLEITGSRVAKNLPFYSLTLV